MYKLCIAYVLVLKCFERVGCTGMLLEVEGQFQRLMLSVKYWNY